ncbi:hypothetical protein [Flavobacterium sp. Root420]|uniref:hypothetical protein n=1 Tax=Flavobacterium sp. Root420 TaxID=1736533 RepID=UPI000B08DE17|nr:hypothetical protein [Flavobacterium sp. Root420]
MTTSQYFMKLLALSDSEKEYQDSDLENSIIKILSDNNSSFFNLAALFEAEGGREEEVINIEIINKIANTLGLLFINPKEREGKVCFANSQDLRPDFKQSFVLLDLLNFSSAVLHSRIYRQGKQDFLEIPIPSDSCIFWQLVQIGSNLRNK